MSIDLKAAIPTGNAHSDEWKDSPIDHSHPAFNDSLVPLGPFTEDAEFFCPEIFTDGVYYGERKSSPYAAGELKGALITSFVRLSVAKKLAEASKLLPRGYALMTLDTLRTPEVQTSLFNYFKTQLMAPPYNYSAEKADNDTQQYVSKPKPETAPHFTGGAVDLTIVKFSNRAWEKMEALTAEMKNIAHDPRNWERVYEIEMRRYQLLREEGKMLDMGVAFDEVALDPDKRDKTALRYYEEKLEREGTLSVADQERLYNRRMLYNALTAVGFTMYRAEPWHADYGTRLGTVQSGQPAFYSAAQLSPENWAHEMMRRDHHKGTIILREQSRKTALKSVKDLWNAFGRVALKVDEYVHLRKQSLFDQYRKAALKAAKKNGDITSFFQEPKFRGHRIKPPEMVS